MTMAIFKSFRSGLIAAVIVALACPVRGQTRPGKSPESPVAAPSTQAGAARNLTMLRALALSQESRKQWSDLIQTMHQVAAQLEKSDPQSARAIAAAAQKAEEAFIADDMDKVARLLEAGLLVPADAAQAAVIKKLRDVLETLRAGGEDIEARLVKLENLEQMIEAIKELLKRQRDLERQSRAIAFGDKSVAMLADAAKQIDPLLAAQKDLLIQTQALRFDPVGEKLLAGGQSLQAFLKRQNALLQELADPFPSPDKMATNLMTVRTLNAELTTARIAIRTLMNETAVVDAVKSSGVVEQAAGVEAAVVKAMEEEGRTAKALTDDNLDDAQTAAAEARDRLSEALKNLGDTMVKLKGSEAVQSALQKQQKLLDQLLPIESVVEELAPAASDAPADQPAGQRKPRFWAGSPPAAPGAVAKVKNGPDSRVGASTRPADAVVPPALAALRRFDREAAALEQQAIIELINQWTTRLASARGEIADRQKNPEYPRQQAEQQVIARGLAIIAAGSNPATTQPTTRPIPTIPSDLHASNGKAGDLANSAAVLLDQQKPADANRDQIEVIRLLEQSIIQLQALHDALWGEVEGELSDQAMAALERVVLAQKRVNADTLALWEKRLPDGTYRRAELLAFSPLALQQGNVLNDMDYMEHLMSIAVSAHSKVIFPASVHLGLRLARSDIKRVKEWIDARDIAKQTQDVQRDVLERLEGMLKAMRSEKENLSKPPAFGEKTAGSPDMSKVDRTAELQMLLVLQGQINRRTQELDQVKKAGKGNPDAVDAEIKELSSLQNEVGEIVQSVVAEYLDQLEHPKPRQ